MGFLRGDNRWVVLHNGDWSGGVIIRRIEGSKSDEKVTEECALPGSFLKTLAHYMMAEELQTVIENALEAHYRKKMATATSRNEIADALRPLYDTHQKHDDPRHHPDCPFCQGDIT